ncbi:MAG: hypothetical protein M3539_18345 [Acidobacteriota bacterium]|nr:hypothetical protein [Acidobacteriota bacterium]
MKRLLMTVALICALTGSALAGDMPTIGVTAPAPSGTESSAVVTVLLTIINLVV